MGLPYQSTSESRAAGTFYRLCDLCGDNWEHKYQKVTIEPPEGNRQWRLLVGDRVYEESTLQRVIDRAGGMIL